MRVKKLSVLTAMLVLIGGLSGCGKGTPTDKTIPPSTVWAPTNVRLETGPSEAKSAVTTTKTGQKSTIILNNGENGDAILSKIDGATGDIVKIFVRPDYGYEPEKVLFNGREITGVKGNYSIVLVDGENKIDVSYKHIKPILTTPSTTYKQEFKVVKEKCDDNVLIYDDTDEANKFIGVNNLNASYKQNWFMEFVSCVSTLTLNENNTDGKFLFNAVIGTTTSYSFEALIDAATFNEKTKYEDLEVKAKLLTPVKPNEFTKDYEKEYKNIFVESIDGLLKRFSSKRFIYNIDLYSLGFYHYPGQFEIEYTPEEFMNENTSIEYATQIADIRNFSISKYNLDNYNFDFCMSGIKNYIRLEKLGEMSDVFIFLFKDRIRFLYVADILKEYLYSNLFFMSIDVPNDGGEKVRLKGFTSLLSDRDYQLINTDEVFACYEIVLDEPVSLSEKMFNLTNKEVFTNYVDKNHIEHKDDFPLNEKELNILNNRLMFEFRKACLNFMDEKDGYDFINLKIVKSFNKQEAIKYNTLNVMLDNSKEIYKKWHQDLNKFIRAFDNKDLTTTDLVEVKLKDIKLPEAAVEVMGGSNQLPNYILRSENNRIQFGLEYKKDSTWLNNISMITLPDENQSSFEIEQVIKVTNNPAESDYYHRTIDLKTWVSEAKTPIKFTCYDSSAINSDLTIKPNSIAAEPKIVSTKTTVPYRGTLFNSTLISLFSGFADYSVCLSFGLVSCNHQLYLTGGVDA